MSPQADGPDVLAVAGWLQAHRRLPVSTYRLQFQPGFGFGDAAALISYLAALGITDCYSSPYLKAAPGTRHGYDICNHNELNPDLGSQEDYEAFTSALAAHRMGQIVDFVPNHMGIDVRTNEWWRDVLENGPSSIFAEFFDIDWDPVKPELANKILLPVLDDQYGLALERGDLRLVFDSGALWLTYREMRLPINPRESPLVLRYGLETIGGEPGIEPSDPDLQEFLSILTALQNLPLETERDPARMVERRRESQLARGRLARLAAASAPIAAHIAQAVHGFNGDPGSPSSFDRLHGLLEVQAYRLAYWRTASDEINYRRFFDINELAGLRMQNPRVFAASHALLLRLVGEGKVTGVRVDHPDGLFDPRAYFDRLQEAALLALVDTLPEDLCPPDQREGVVAARRAPQRVEGVHDVLVRPLYVVAEKILSSRESPPESWSTHGTTGYEFLNDVNGLFVDRENAIRLRRMYARLTGHREAFREVVHQCKRLIIATAMASEFTVLSHAIKKLSERSRRWRDFTLNNFHRALLEFVACLPVYRTYVSQAGATLPDRVAIEAALGEARRRNPVLESTIFDFLRGVLLPHEAPAAGEGGATDLSFEERLAFAMGLQQHTGEVQAKAVEDTAFYRYNVLLSLNEVGGSPERVGRTLDEFHAANCERLARWPRQMVTTATHDTKRGEDARARLNVLSEIPEEWRRGVVRWMRINAANRTLLAGEPAPDRNDEYLFYQALLGAWPAEASDAPVPTEAPPELVERLSAFMQKAIREAKVHTSWINENHAYEEAVRHFVQHALAGRTAARFLAAFVPFERRVAQSGMVNSLSQLVLKLASPGVADFYQGSELWDLSLVDPDNRRLVDYAVRRQMLTAIRPWLSRAAQWLERSDDTADRDLSVAACDWLTHWEDGRIKLFVTSCGLDLRRRKSLLLLEGSYTPLHAGGASAQRLVAFSRRHGNDLLVVIVPRLIAPLTTPEHPLPVGAEMWGDTRVMLPDGAPAALFRNVLTGETCRPVANGRDSWVTVADVFRTCPVALLWARLP